MATQRLMVTLPQAFYSANSFSEAVLLAANLGDDADTTAAIAGQLAGALYGKHGIPDKWLEMLAWREKIEALAVALLYGRATSE